MNIKKTICFRILVAFILSDKKRAHPIGPVGSLPIRTFGIDSPILFFLRFVLFFLRLFLFFLRLFLRFVRFVLFFFFVLIVLRLTSTSCFKCLPIFLWENSQIKDLLIDGGRYWPFVCLFFPFFNPSFSYISPILFLQFFKLFFLIFISFFVH